MSTVKFVAVALTDLPRLTKGQMGHLLQGTIPGVSLLGLRGALGGTLFLISLSLIFAGLLYATRGGSGNVSAKWGSAFMVLQCF